MASATRRAWPPAPNVASTTVAPGLAARSATTSRYRTGMCGESAVGFPRQTLGNNVHAPFEFLERLAPGVPVPDLEPVAHAGDDDVAGERREADQRSREGDAALAIHLDL